MKGIFLVTIVFGFVHTSFPQEQDTIRDGRDGKIYKTVKIGTQWWMAENLNFETPANSWCNQCETYGRLYSYNAAINVCPSGWHLPSDAEWTTLTDYLGGEEVAGGKLKSILGWTSPNYRATNSSGFKALPGGSRGYDGAFSIIGRTGWWWTSTEGHAGRTCYRFMSYYYCDVYKGCFAKKESGYSVRCVKNQ